MLEFLRISFLEHFNARSLLFVYQDSSNYARRNIESHKVHRAAR